MRGLYGPPELRREEKIRYLGEFRERVVLALTQKQVRQSGIPRQVKDALDAHPDVTLVLNGEMEYGAIAKYIRLANARNVPYRKVYDHEHDTDIGLVLASPEPVDVPNIYIADGDGPPAAGAAASSGDNKAAAAAGPDKPVPGGRRGILGKWKAGWFRRNRQD